MTDVILRKIKLPNGLPALVSVDDEGADVLTKLPVGRDVGANIVQHRNPRHHRLFFAMVRLLREHTEMFAGKDTEIITTAIKLATGLVKTYVDRAKGTTVLVPMSISWAKMDQTRFNKFFDAACTTIALRWFPEGTLPDDVRRELISMVDGPGALGSKVA
jgi:Protein of unknown function (DUF1367)